MEAGVQISQNNKNRNYHMSQLYLSSGDGSVGLQVSKPQRSLHISAELFITAKESNLLDVHQQMNG